MSPIPPHSLAPKLIPVFIVSPGSTDYFLVGAVIFLVSFVLAVGLLILRIHMLPDHIAHKSHKVQFEIVAVLGLLAMVTHVQAFWIAALLLALIDIPDFGSPLRRISGALERMAGNREHQESYRDSAPSFIKETGTSPRMKNSKNG